MEDVGDVVCILFFFGEVGDCDVGVFVCEGDCCGCVDVGVVVGDECFVFG